MMLFASVGMSVAVTEALLTWVQFLMACEAEEKNAAVEEPEVNRDHIADVHEIASLLAGREALRAFEEPHHVARAELLMVLPRDAGHLALV